MEAAGPGQKPHSRPSGRASHASCDHCRPLGAEGQHGEQSQESLGRASSRDDAPFLSRTMALAAPSATRIAARTIRTPPVPLLSETPRKSPARGGLPGRVPAPVPRVLTHERRKPGSSSPLRRRCRGGLLWAKRLGRGRHRMEESLQAGPPWVAASTGGRGTAALRRRAGEKNPLTGRRFLSYHRNVITLCSIPSGGRLRRQGHGNPASAG